jgi:phenylacetate-CoA ligase
VRLHQTSGTTGRPLRWLDTADSWRWVLDCWEQIYRWMDVLADDVFAFPFSFGPFLGFWAAFEGACRLGRLSLAGGGLSSEGRLRLIVDNGATILCCTPTYALRLAEAADGLGLDLPRSSVRAIVVAGEPGGSVPQIRKRIEAAWGARVIDHWGMTEIGPLGIEPALHPGGLLTLGRECLAEIVDPATGAAVPPGAQGELVITNLGRWGQPVIRYRTGDLVQAAPAPGFDAQGGVYLLGGVQGRVDDMFIVRGNNVFPSAVEAVLREFDDVAEYRLTLRTLREMPQLVIDLEPAPQLNSGQQTDLVDRVHLRIKERLNFLPEVRAVPSGSLPRFELKGRRFFRES